jgi:hypothetical protein
MVDERESELELSGLLSALSFGASFEELANFLIDKVDVPYAAPSCGHTPPTAIRLLSFPERLSALCNQALSDSPLGARRGADGGPFFTTLPAAAHRRS